VAVIESIAIRQDDMTRWRRDILLAAAKYLAETRRFDGVANFVSPPAEEGLGGACAIIADGLFERFPCEAVFVRIVETRLAKQR